MEGSPRRRTSLIWDLKNRLINYNIKIKDTQKPKKYKNQKKPKPKYTPHLVETRPHRTTNSTANVPQGKITSREEEKYDYSRENIVIRETWWLRLPKNHSQSSSLTSHYYICAVYRARRHFGTTSHTVSLSLWVA